MTSHTDAGTAGERSVRVGEILRRKREERQISVEAVAKKLRLHASYIEALEADDYGKLPGDTYVRVYLKSLCIFFSLDAEKVLEQFFKERGVTGVDTLRKDSSTKINLAAAEKEKPNTVVIVAIVLLAMLMVVSLIAQRHGRQAPRKAGDAAAVMKQETPRNDSAQSRLNQTPGAAKADSAKTARPPQTHAAVPRPADTPKAAAVRPAPVRQAPDTPKVKKEAQPARASRIDTVSRPPVTAPPAKETAGGQKTHEIKAAAVAKETSSAAAAKDTAARTVVSPVKELPAAAAARKDTVKKTEAAPQKPVKDSGGADAAVRDSTGKNVPPAAVHTAGNTMKLRVTVTADSCWICVFSDGKPWRKVLGGGRVRSFTANDSFNVQIGVSNAVSFTLDGKPIQLPSSKVRAFTIDRSGVTSWTLDKWNSAFKDRF